jgi:hypothetical protein
MRRREALQWVGRGIGATALVGVSAHRLLAVGQDLHHRIATRPGPQRVLQVLDPHQDHTVSVIAEHIIPETDTPGARAAGVNEFIDLMLAEWLDDDERAGFLRGLAAVDARSLNMFGTVFVQLTEARQLALLEGLDAEVTALRGADAAGNDHFFNRMKWLTLFGYYTSEIGQTQELQASVVPGRYDPCGPVLRDTPGGW